MANINGRKYALTSLFPIEPGEHYEHLRKYLRGLDKDPHGSPLAKVGCVHMARFAIIDDLIYQGLPAKRDRLQSRYLLFTCDFDGDALDVLVGAMFANVPGVIDDIWQHCVAYPGTGSRDRLIEYFERCQLKTSLFFADRPKDEVRSILRALMYKRAFVQFIEKNQGQPAAGLQQRFYAMLRHLDGQPAPLPGSM